MKNQCTNVSNTNRIFYLDFMRGLAVFFMILQHAIIIHERTSGEGNTILGNLFVILGTAPAAPVFIFIMGVFFIKSNKPLKQNILRGLKLFVFGYTLNLLRFTIPVFLAGAPFEYNQDPLSLFFTVDIFQLCGLSLIIFSGLKKYSKNPYILPSLILVILTVSPYLWEYNKSIFAFEPLWGINENTDFPLFPWSIYFLLGMYFSKYFYEENLQRNLKKRLILISITLGFIGLITLPLFPIGDYYRSGLSVHFLMMSFILLWLVFSDYLIAKLNSKNSNKVLGIIYYWSKKVTPIYILQWLLFGWSILILGAHKFSSPIALIIGLIILIIVELLLKHTKIESILPKL